MPRVRTIRPFVCLLLAVSTGGGTVMTPYRACACVAHRGGPVGAPALAASPATVPAPPSCCGCCPPAPATPDCCHAGSANSAGWSGDVGTKGCECVRCEGDHPVQLPDSPPPGGGVVADHLVALAAAVTNPSAVLFPPEWNRPDRHAHVNTSTPIVLVLVLSRLTI